jgi:acetoin utilization deacetylase AcuC-like enzyme
MAMEIADRHCEGRVISLLEGGYNVTGLAEAAAAHVTTLLGKA